MTDHNKKSYEPSNYEYNGSYDSSEEDWCQESMNSTETESETSDDSWCLDKEYPNPYMKDNKNQKLITDNFQKL